DGARAFVSAFFQPQEAILAPDGRTIVVVDTYDNRVRAIDPSTHGVRTIAGSGDAGDGPDGVPATSASLNHPTAAAFGPDGSLYVADTWNDRVRRVDPAGTITTVAGTGSSDGPGLPCGVGVGGDATKAGVCSPEGVAVR